MRNWCCNTDCNRPQPRQHQFEEHSVLQHSRHPNWHIRWDWWSVWHCWAWFKDTPYQPPGHTMEIQTYNARPSRRCHLKSLQKNQLTALIFHLQEGVSAVHVQPYMDRELDASCMERKTGRDRSLATSHRVYNAGIRLATGALRTNRLEYLESGDPPRSLRMNLLLWCCEAGDPTSSPVTWCSIPFETLQKYELHTAASELRELAFASFSSNSAFVCRKLFPYRVSVIPPDKSSIRPAISDLWDMREV